MNQDDDLFTKQHTESKRFLQSLSKNSRRVDMAELKLKYEDQLETKNERIIKLEQKNQEYLDMIS